MPSLLLGRSCSRPWNSCFDASELSTVRRASVGVGGTAVCDGHSQVRDQSVQPLLDLHEILVACLLEVAHTIDT